MLYVDTVSLSLPFQGPIIAAHGHKTLSPNKALKGNSVWALFCEPAVMILFMINTTLILLVKAKDQRSEMALFMTTEVLSVTVDRSTPPDPPLLHSYKPNTWW